MNETLSAICFPKQPAILVLSLFALSACSVRTHCDYLEVTTTDGREHRFGVNEFDAAYIRDGNNITVWERRVTPQGEKRIDKVSLEGIATVKCSGD